MTVFNARGDKIVLSQPLPCGHVLDIKPHVVYCDAVGQDGGLFRTKAERSSVDAVEGTLRRGGVETDVR